MNSIVSDLSQEEISTFCQKHHIRRLAFFGSVVRDDFAPHSDIDVLVEFDPEHIPGFDFFLMEAELSKLIGRKVDFLTPDFLSSEICKTALSESVVAYEQSS